MRRPADFAPKWNNKELMCERAEMCITFLMCHGLMSDGEKAKARARIQKAIRRWNDSKEAEAEKRFITVPGFGPPL